MSSRVPSILLPTFRTVLGALLAASGLACESKEAKQMQQIAGTYAMMSHDRFANQLLDGSTMTLEADGTWSSAVRMDPSLGMPWARESGTWVYRADGPTLGLRSSEGRPMNLLVKGDTLVGVRDERAVALAEAVTNVKATGQGPGAFYVRKR